MAVESLTEEVAEKLNFTPMPQTEPRESSSGVLQPGRPIREEGKAVGLVPLRGLKREKLELPCTVAKTIHLNPDLVQHREVQIGHRRTLCITNMTVALPLSA